MFGCSHDGARKSRTTMKNMSLVATLAFSIALAFTFRTSGAINDPITIPVMIKGAGSGCYLVISNHLYLATARHVLYGPYLTNLIPKTRLISYFGTPNAVKTVLEADFPHLETNGHIRFSTNYDVATVRIGAVRSNSNELS